MSALEPPRPCIRMTTGKRGSSEPSTTAHLPPKKILWVIQLLLATAAHQQTLRPDVDFGNIRSRLGACENGEVLLVRQVFQCERRRAVPGKTESQIADGLDVEIGVPFPVHLEESPQTVRQVVGDDVLDG